MNCKDSKRSETEDEGDSSSADIVNTPSLGTRRWLRRRWAGVGVEQGLCPTKGKPEVDASGAVRGASSTTNFPCCHDPLAFEGAVETSRMGVVGGVTSLSSPNSDESSQTGKVSQRCEVISTLARRDGCVRRAKAGCKEAADSP